MTPDEKWLLEEKYGGKRTAEYEQDTRRLLAGEPLGYVIGWQPFLGLKIYLDSKPFIPRPETEWWTEQLLLPYVGRTTSHIRFLDLCAGSGAIGCAALARIQNVHVCFGEIDPAHETTILKNIRENNLNLLAGRQARRADVRIGDLFEPFGDMTFDIIAANPPYIPAGRALPRSVFDHEPALALFAEEDGLDLIRRIATELPRHLAKGGIAWVECDNAHAEAARELFAARDLKAKIRTDQYGKPRVIIVSFP